MVRCAAAGTAVTWKHVASGTAIARYVAEQLAQGVPSSLAEFPNPTGRDISMAAEQGDPLAKAALARAGTYIGYALANYLHIFNPSIIILGGGVSRSGPFLIEPLRTAIARAHHFAGIPARIGDHHRRAG